MIMIGGNSRNAGKTTLACNIISKLSAHHKVIGLKVTSIRPGEDDMHGNHSGDKDEPYTIHEELNTASSKDTSRMLQAGAAHVYYIRVSDDFVEQALMQFFSVAENDCIIVCESRSLRKLIVPGHFVMMIRMPAVTNEKDIKTYLGQADKVFDFTENSNEIAQYINDLQLVNGKITAND